MNEGHNSSHFEFFINGIDKLDEVMANSPVIARKHVDRAIQRSLVRVMGGIKEEAPVGVSAGMRDRWNIITSAFQGKLRSGTAYSRYVHDGTRPHWTSKANLQEWADKRGIPVGALQRSIARKGTKANPFLTRTMTKVDPDIQHEFIVALYNIVGELSWE